MSFLDTMIYSFSNMFSIGPDMYDTDDNCCGGSKDYNGLCCKNIQPTKKPEPKKDAILTCTQKKQLYDCHCPSNLNSIKTTTTTTTIKLISCGNNMTTSTWPIPFINQQLDNIKQEQQGKEDEDEKYKLCTVLLDHEQCQDILLSSPVCIFLLSDIKSNGALDRLMGWMNDQIILSTQPLHHLKYGIILVNDDLQQIGRAFDEKLKQLGAITLQPMYITALQHNNDMTLWLNNFINQLNIFSLQQHHQYNNNNNNKGIDYDPSVIASAGCTNGMVDVEDMGQVARKIKEVKRKKADRDALVKRRGRAKRMVGMDILSSSSDIKASPTTELSTVETSVSMTS
ncbi:unnamed protein product [Cunninghamella echinulata]